MLIHLPQYQALIFWFKLDFGTLLEETVVIQPQEP